jgi:hypothetical protein
MAVRHDDDLFGFDCVLYFRVFKLGLICILDRVKSSIQQSETD